MGVSKKRQGTVRRSITLCSMVSAQPQTIGGALFGEVTALFDSGTRATVFELKRLWNDADKLQKVDASEASVVKSALAAYEWNAVESRRWLNNAISLRKSAITYLNAAATMRVLNDFGGARDYARLAANLAPNDAEVVFQAVGCFVGSGRLSEAYELALPFKGRSETLTTSCTEIEDLQRKLSEIGVSEAEVSREIDIASMIAISNKVRIHDSQFRWAVDTDGSKCLYIPMLFFGSIDSELKLEQELAVALLEEDGWNPMKLSVEFTHQ